MAVVRGVSVALGSRSHPPARQRAAGDSTPAALDTTRIDHPLDAHGHGGVTFGKGESQISVAVNNRPEAGVSLPVQYETFCGLLRLTV